MKIGIDISQLAYPKTGVANYLENFIKSLLMTDNKNEYVFFFSSFRGKFDSEILDLTSKSNAVVRKYRIPPTVLDLMWNKLHIVPIERFIGDVDLFITSDWTEPPTRRAKKATILYDLIVYKFPSETNVKIVKTQKRKLKWVKKETDIVFAISNSTKKDAQEILKFDSDKIKVIYPGI